MSLKVLDLWNSLNTNVHPGELSHAFAFGMLLGFMPKNSLLWFMLFFISLFLRINKPVLLISIAFGLLFTSFLDPLFDILGYAILTVPPLEGFYTALLSVPFVAFTRFNNSVVMGSLVFGLLVYVPLYFFARFFLSVWRTNLKQRLLKSPFAIFVKRIPLAGKISETLAQFTIRGDNE